MFAQSLMGHLLALAALLLFSLNIVLTKVASARLNLNLGFLVAVSVNVIFCLFLFALRLAFSNRGWHWDLRGLWLFLLAGAFSTYLGRWFFLEAIVKFGPARASIFQISSPVFNAVIAWGFLDEALKGMTLTGMAIAIVGLVLVVYAPGTLTAKSSDPGPLAAVTQAGGRFKKLLQSGVLLAMGSSLAYAIGNVLRGAAIRSWSESVFGAFLGAASGLILHILLSRGRTQFLSQLKTADRSGLLLFCISGMLSISAQICTIASMKQIPVSVATLITLCSPVLVLPMSYFFFKNQEAITIRTILGCMLTLGGISMILLH